MTQYNPNVTYNQGNAISFRSYLSKVFGITALGILISSIISVVVSMNIYSIAAALGSSFGTVSLVLIVAELAVALIFSFGLRKMSKAGAWVCYIAYCVLTGLTLSTVLAIYEVGSVVFAFVATTILFGCMAFIGHTTRMDLTRFGTILTAGLVAIIITSLLNALFFKSSTINYIMIVVGVIVFLGIIAYDVQKLQRYYNEGSIDPEFGEKMMIMGAFQAWCFTAVRRRLQGRRTAGNACRNQR